MRNLVFALLLGLVVGCQGAREDPPKAGEALDHNTLGIWPNVVVVVDTQKTAADLLNEILDEAVTDAGGPNLPWDQFKMVVDLVQKCGRNTGTPAPPTITAHAAKLQSALTNARKHTPADWAACIGDLGHGH